MHFSGSNKKSSQFQENSNAKTLGRAPHTPHIYLSQLAMICSQCCPSFPSRPWSFRTAWPWTAWWVTRPGWAWSGSRSGRPVYCTGVLWTVLCRSGARWRSLCLFRTSRRSGQRWLSTSSPTSQRQPQTRSERKIGKWQISLKLLKKEGSLVSHDIL